MPGDLVVIRDPDVVESFTLRVAADNEVLYGVLVSISLEDPVNPKDDIWIVLVENQLWKMLRFEFEPVSHRE
jgi:hypothetical protein